MVGMVLHGHADVAVLAGLQLLRGGPSGGHTLWVQGQVGGRSTAHTPTYTAMRAHRTVASFAGSCPRKTRSLPTAGR